MPATVLGTGQKLRNSCDSCNLAKVKCSKGRPSCTRCEAQGVQCIYGISMRAGKHRAAGSNIQKPRPESATSTRPSTKENTPQPTFPDIKAEAFDSGLNSLMENMPINGDWSSMLTDDYNPYLMGTGMDLDNDAEKRHFSDDFAVQSPSEFSLDPSHLMNQSLFNGSPQSYPSYLDHRALTSSTLTSDSAASSRRNSPTSTSASCNCNQRVLQQLLNLTQIPDMPSAYDQALNQNKKVISFCHSILEDQGQHSHDISFVLTLTALIAKVIAVYDAIYNPYNQSGGSKGGISSLTSEHLSAFHDLDMASEQMDPLSMSAPSSAITTHANNSPFSSTTNLSSAMTSAMASPRNSTSGAGYPMRLTLGTYRLDEKDEEKLKWDIFKIELSKVGQLVSAFEQKYCDAVLYSPAHHEQQMQQQPQSKYEAKAYEDMVYYP